MARKQKEDILKGLERAKKAIENSDKKIRSEYFNKNYLSSSDASKSKLTYQMSYAMASINDLIKNIKQNFI